MIRLLLLGTMFLGGWSLQTDAATNPKTRQRVDRYLEKVKRQPDWLVSRLQMYWQSHATDVYIDGERFHHAGGDRAPVPTVRLCGTRSTSGDYNRPSLENVVPYDDDSLSQVTYINKATGKQEKVHPSKTGSSIASVNREILGIARDAALVFQETGDTVYARMAFDVFDTFMRGIYYRKMPNDLRKSGTQDIVGITTFEVIHEDAVKETTSLYLALGRYIQHNRDLYEEAFKRWAQVIIDNGVPNNNWNLIQADLISKVAVVLRDNSAYPDCRGKAYYQNYIVNQSSQRQWALSRLASYGFDKNTHIWNESPGYSVNVVNEFAELANRLDRDAGINLFDSIPQLLKTVEALPQYLMPNRMICGFGDTHPNYLSTLGAKSVMEYAKRKGLTAMYQHFDSLCLALSPTASAQEIGRWVSPSFYSPNVSWLVLRSGMDKQHDLMVSMNGSLGNHQHANGISVELYGKGFVLAPDGGIGGNLYSGDDYKHYYSQFPAHNTVCVDGQSSYRVMLSEHPFKVIRQETNYATVAFKEPKTDADQQRTVAIVKTSDKGGYYIDVFRSKREGKGQFHDYFYHNLGQEMILENRDKKRRQNLGYTLSSLISSFSSQSILPAYSKIQVQQSCPTFKDVKATFTTSCRDSSHIRMTMWMKGEKNRTVYKALSPANMEYERLGDFMPYDIRQQPVLTFVAHQQGEAWKRPFVAVYEPSSDAEEGDIANVEFFKPHQKNAVGILVTLKDGRQQRVVCKENGEVSVE